MEVFIPERYVARLSLLVHVKGYGLGLRIPAAELGPAVKDGRVHANALGNRDVVAIMHPIHPE